MMRPQILAYRIDLSVLGLIALLLFCKPTYGAEKAESAAAPQQKKNVVYGEAHGVGLIMDVWTPSGKSNGKAIIDVISGGWDSGRGKMRDHEMSQVFRIMCGRGYTVFAIRPGSLSKFSVPEMVSHLEQGIVWVKQHASEYGIAPDRLGLMGASAGGHLASLVAVKNGSSSATPGVDKPTVHAVGAFFPPTDLVEYGGQETNPKSPFGIGALLRQIAFPEGIDNLSDDEIRDGLVAISPARLVSEDAPPFLLFHGTADTTVPIEQSQKLVSALRDKGVSVELIVKEGGGHPWLTIHEEVAKLADWFDEQL